MPEPRSILTSCQQRLVALCIMLCVCLSAAAQANLRMADNSNSNSRNSRGSEKQKRGGDRFSAERDTTEKEIPIGQFQWVVEPRLGTVVDAENNDTVVHNFQSYNLTEGYDGQYSFLGNVGSPRLNRIFLNREPAENFLFIQPLSFFRDGLKNFRFTNTLSPITNLAYHKCGNSENGEDRVRAYFATNINRISGLGFKLDYLYGRGYYNSSANSQFGGTVYGYYRGERYNLHAYVNINHLYMAENGGIEDDRYIEDPQSFQQRYSSKDIPVNLTETWNRTHEQNFYLTHRYNVGFEREIEVPDSLKPKMPQDQEFLMQLKDSVRTVLATDSTARALVLDSLRNDWQSQQIPPMEFVPVSSFIHTIDLRRMNHNYLSRGTPDDFYTNHYYGSWNDVHDDTRAMSLRNTIGVALREGFNKWAQMGISLYASHLLRTYTLPQLTDSVLWEKKYIEHDFTVGGVINRTQGKLIHYNVDSELWLAGENVGDFTVDGDANLDLNLGKLDTMQVVLNAYIHHQKPGFYLRHYHSQATWWDNTNLDRELRTRIMGTLSLQRTKTRLTVGAENVTNYTYFGIQNSLKADAVATSTLPTDYTHAVAVRQHNGSIQVFSATLAQDFKFGPVHWDSQATYQKSSDEKVLPLPQVTLYTNLYLLFRYARVLRVQIGADMRYFTSYYAPDYAPSIGQFATQDATFARMKIGNYPIINVYANLHLKHCRLYASVNHVNEGNGHSFWAPHYPINPFTIHFGLSWNFFN